MIRPAFLTFRTSAASWPNSGCATASTPSSARTSAASPDSGRTPADYRFVMRSTSLRRSGNFAKYFSSSCRKTVPGGAVMSSTTAVPLGVLRPVVVSLQHDLYVTDARIAVIEAAIGIHGRDRHPGGHELDGDVRFRHFRRSRRPRQCEAGECGAHRRHDPGHEVPFRRCRGRQYFATTRTPLGGR